MDDYRERATLSMARKINGRLHVYVEREIDISYCDPERAIEQIQLAADGLVNPSMNIDVEDSWRSSTTRSYVSGYRPLATDEKKRRRKILADEREREAARLEQAGAEARKLLIEQGYRIQKLP